MEFELFINRKNKDWVSQGVFIDLIVWEDFLDAVSKIRLQDEYNKAIRECDVFVLLFCTKVGKHTEEEFETAFGQFKATQKPFIFTYFKDAEISTRGANKKDLISLWEFQDKLDQLGHFYTVYKNTDGLKFHFNQQLDKLAKNGFIELKRGSRDIDAIPMVPGTNPEAEARGQPKIWKGLFGVAGLVVVVVLALIWLRLEVDPQPPSAGLGPSSSQSRVPSAKGPSLPDKSEGTISDDVIARQPLKAPSTEEDELIQVLVTEDYDRVLEPAIKKLQNMKSKKALPMLLKHTNSIWISVNLAARDAVIDLADLSHVNLLKETLMDSRSPIKAKETAFNALLKLDQIEYMIRLQDGSTYDLMALDFAIATDSVNLDEYLINTTAGLVTPLVTIKKLELLKYKDTAITDDERTKMYEDDILRRSSKTSYTLKLNLLSGEMLTVDTEFKDQESLGKILLGLCLRGTEKWDDANQEFQRSKGHRDGVVSAGIVICNPFFCKRRGTAGLVSGQACRASAWNGAFFWPFVGPEVMFRSVFVLAGRRPKGGCRLQD